MIPALRALLALAVLILVGEILFRGVLAPALGITIVNTPDFTQWPEMLYLGALLPVVMAGISLLLFRFLDRRPLSEFGLKMNKGSLKVALWGMALMILGFVLFIGITQYLGIGRYTLARATAGRFVLTAVVTYIGVGVWEEFFFRGYLYNTLTDYGKPAAYIVSILVFAFIHFSEESLELSRVLDLLLVSFMLTYVYDRTGSIWPGVILHGAWDLFNMLLIGNLPRTSLLLAFGDLNMPDRWLSIALNAALIVLTWIICRGKRTRRRTKVIRNFM